MITLSNNFASRISIATGFLFALFSLSAQADDGALGLSWLTAPLYDGEAELAVTLQLPAGVALSQTPLTTPPAGNSMRVTLRYSTAVENFSVRRRIVAEAQSLGSGRYRLTAVLPQNSLQQVPSASIYPLNTRYYENPIKLRYNTAVRYRWEIERNASVQPGDVHEFALPHPLVVAIMGDSFSSGEGAPDSTSTFHDQVGWAFAPAHRSFRNGHRQGVVRFLTQHPGIWVEFRHVAISGTTISPAIDASGGMSSDYSSSRNLKMVSLLVPTLSGACCIPVFFPLALDPNTRIEGQVSQIERWLANEGFLRTHVMVVSAGGNDAGFGDIILKAMYGALSLGFGQTLRDFRDDLDTMKDAARDQMEPALDDIIRPRHILWTNYPDLTLSQDVNDPRSAVHVDPSINYGLMIADASLGSVDMENAAILLREELNPAVAEMCNEFNVRAGQDRCRLLDIQDTVRGHGINAPAPARWFNSFQDAQDEVEGVTDGVVHPNAQGTLIYATAVADALNQLYDPERGSEYLMMREAARQAAAEAAKARARASVQAKQTAAKTASLQKTAELAVDPRRAAIEKVEAQGSLRIGEADLKRAADNRRSRLAAAKISYQLQHPKRNLTAQKTVVYKLPDPAMVKQLEERLRMSNGAKAASEFRSLIDSLRAAGPLDSRQVQAAIDQEQANLQKRAASSKR